MKTTTSIIAVTLILLLSLSCAKEPLVRYGFDSQFGKNSKGLSIMAVKNYSGAINLKGTVKVDIGEVIIELTDPDGISVFYLHLNDFDSFDISKTFRTKKGYWKLQYTSFNGVGVIDLHLDLIQ